YLTSPIWRFGVSEGICGDQAWAGLMLPSVDKIGRYYPLTLAAPIAGNAQLFILAQGDDEWFSDLERVALSVLENNPENVDFNENVAALQPPPTNQHNQGSQPSDIGGAISASADHWIMEVEPPDQFNRSSLYLARQLLLDKISRLSLWWTRGSEHVRPCVLISAELPAASGFAALLDGDWSRWGWNNRQVLVGPATSNEPHNTDTIP
ncbi:MAG: type VI secretion system-associated protein TagF, partial [Gammaproteobacteria bacterium]|nr:type VI secretion system-associated protein TagF [Gammaproteobacteria bacterium]